MLYEISDSDLLSDDAAALESEALETYAAVAERLLGLGTPKFTATADIQIATLAVARQVSKLVALVPEADVLSSWTSGSRSETYRDNVDILDAVAVALIDSIDDGLTLKERYGDWPTVRSVRPIAFGSYNGGRDVIPYTPWFQLPGLR